MSDEKSGVSFLTAEDIMTAGTYTVTMDMTVEAVMRDLVTQKYSGAPIIDSANRVISVISEVDIMKFAAAGGIQRKVGDFADKLVGEDKVLKVQKKDSFKEIFKHFLLNPVRRVIVVDGSDKVQGIISRRDILHAFLAAEEHRAETE